MRAVGSSRSREKLWRLFAGGTVARTTLGARFGQQWVQVPRSRSWFGVQAVEAST